MPTDAPTPIPGCLDNANRQLERLRSDLIDERDHTIGMIDQIMQGLDRFKSLLPHDLRRRLTSAYEEVRCELEAIDPENPPDAAKINFVVVRLTLLHVCIQQLFGAPAPPVTSHD